VSYESAGAVLRLLTAENRELLAAIDKTHPESVAALAKQLHRAEPNVSRTLSKLEACGLVRLTQGKGKTKIPQVLAVFSNPGMSLKPAQVGAMGCVG
jgi:predicted transcriptional regulator